MRLFILSLLAPAVMSAAAPCDSLSKLSLQNTAQNTTVTKAVEVPAGGFKLPTPGRGPAAAAVFEKLAAFCAVQATLAPVPDSEIKIEVWLPLSGWNGKLQSVGNGAWAGTISYPALANALAAGYAAASTDTGHTGNNPDFIPGHPEKLADFVHRSVHEMTVAAKGIVSAYYGSDAKYSYWNGCSTGGRQALTEAQRYPNDYDGIIAGAPAAYVTRLQGMQVWVAQQMSRDDRSALSSDQMKVLHNAVLEACDSQDGVKDGVLEDPAKCSYDPKALACTEGTGTNCLNAAQVETARMMYAGPKPLYPGLAYGSENGWNMLGPKPMSLAVEMYKYAAFDGKWDMKNFTLADIERFEKEKGKAIDAYDPDLKPFFAHGGKLLLYHGWSDPGVPPMGTVNYQNNVLKATGADAKDSMRLFMVPGMGHCQGGDGTDKFNMIAAMEKWVEAKQAPERIEASRVRDGRVDRTRPLCAYPKVAVYNRKGSTDESANFSCK